MQTFAAYSDAKAAAERIVRELANGSQAAALSASQSRDALAAFERLDGHFKSKGKRVSLNTAVADYLDAIGRLNVPLSAAVTGYLNTVATVKRVDLAAAVKEFVDGRGRDEIGERQEAGIEHELFPQHQALAWLV
jgi:glutaminase